MRAPLLSRSALIQAAQGVHGMHSGEPSGTSTSRIASGGDGIWPVRGRLPVRTLDGDNCLRKNLKPSWSDGAIRQVHATILWECTVSWAWVVHDCRIASIWVVVVKFWKMKNAPTTTAITIISGWNQCPTFGLESMPHIRAGINAPHSAGIDAPHFGLRELRCPSFGCLIGLGHFRADSCDTGWQIPRFGPQ